MMSAAVAQRLKVVKSLRRPRAVRKVLPPVPAAAGAAEVIAAPAVFRPIGLSVTSATGILFPVFLWARANRVGTLHKTEAPQIPAIPEAVIPVLGLAPLTIRKSEVFTLRSIFWFAQWVRRPCWPFLGPTIQPSPASPRKGAYRNVFLNGGRPISVAP